METTADLATTMVNTAVLGAAEFASLDLEADGVAAGEAFLGWMQSIVESQQQMLDWMPAVAAELDGAAGARVEPAGNTYVVNSGAAPLNVTHCGYDVSGGEIRVPWANLIGTANPLYAVAMFVRVSFYVQRNRSAPLFGSTRLTA